MQSETESEEAEEDDGMISMNKEPGTELKEDVMEQIERQNYERLHTIFGGERKKRDNKAGDKEEEKQDKMEK